MKKIIAFDKLTTKNIIALKDAIQLEENGELFFIANIHDAAGKIHLAFFTQKDIIKAITKADSTTRMYEGKTTQSTIVDSWMHTFNQHHTDTAN